MRKFATITLSALFLAAGLIPARSLHYCRMLDRSTLFGCNICHAEQVLEIAQGGCCSKTEPTGQIDQTTQTGDTDEDECCSFRVQGPFAAAATGVSEGPDSSPTRLLGSALIAVPVATPAGSDVIAYGEIRCDIVAPPIALPPARLSGGGFLC